MQYEGDMSRSNTGTHTHPAPFHAPICTPTARIPSVDGGVVAPYIAVSTQPYGGRYDFYRPKCNLKQPQCWYPYTTATSTATPPHRQPNTGLYSGCVKCTKSLESIFNIFRAEREKTKTVNPARAGGGGATSSATFGSSSDCSRSVGQRRRGGAPLSALNGTPTTTRRETSLPTGSVVLQEYHVTSTTSTCTLIYLPLRQHPKVTTPNLYELHAWQLRSLRHQGSSAAGRRLGVLRHNHNPTPKWSHLRQPLAFVAAGGDKHPLCMLVCVQVDGPLAGQTQITAGEQQQHQACHREAAVLPSAQIERECCLCDQLPEAWGGWCPFGSPFKSSFKPEPENQTQTRMTTAARPGRAYKEVLCLVNFYPRCPRTHRGRFDQSCFSLLSVKPSRTPSLLACSIPPPPPSQKWIFKTYIKRRRFPHFF